MYFVPAKMTKIATLTITFALGIGAVFAESISPSNLASGKMLPNSESPDKRFVILEVFHGDTTQNSVVIALSNRSKHIDSLPILTEHATDRPHKGRTIIQWSSDSSLISVSDNLPKHSKLHIFRVTNTGTMSLPIPDLLKRCASDLGVEIDSLRSSGQLPSKWVNGSILEVTVQMKTNRGKLFSNDYRLFIHEIGKVELTPPTE